VKTADQATSDLTVDCKPVNEMGAIQRSNTKSMFPLSSTYCGTREWHSGLIYEMTKDRCIVTHCKYSWNVCMYINRTNCLGFIVSNRLLKDLNKVEKSFRKNDAKRGVTGP
jgi:hypothetical protein